MSENKVIRLRSAALNDDNTPKLELEINCQSGNEEIAVKNDEGVLKSFKTDEHYKVIQESIEEALASKREKIKLSILFIGNSLTQDGIAYLPYMLKNYYPEIDFNIYMWYIGGYTLEQHYSVFTSDGNANIFSVAENSTQWTNYSKSMTMKQVLSTYRFDIVSMQEYFNYKTEYEDVTVWNNCRDYIVSNYTGGNALEFVSLFHAPLRASADTVYDVTCEGNAFILQNTISQDMIPNGMAVYRALSTDLDVMGDKQHLSPDGTHTQEGLPCLMQTYVTLCWLFDRFGINKSVYGHPMRMTKAIYDTISVPGANLGTGVLTGTDAQNLLAQEIAIKAYKEGKQFTMRNLYPYEEKVIQCTFTINTNVESATIKINGVETNSTVVMAGSTVYWDVLADDYHSQSGNEVVSIDTVKYIELMPTIDVTSLEVDFTQGNRTIFDNMELNEFKRLLKVTAHYENGTNMLVSDYVLTGELNEGVSTINVSFGGQSSTFDINVTKFEIPEGYQRYGFIEYINKKLGAAIASTNFIYLPAYEDYNSLSAEMIVGEKQDVDKRSTPAFLGSRLASGAGYPYFGLYFQDNVSVMIRDIVIKVPYPSSTVKMKIYIDNPSTSPVTVQINNGTPVTGEWAESRVLPYGMSLFNNIPNGSTSGMYINYSARIGDIMFRKEDGTCVGYFTPCVKDEVIGMYDQMSQTFYTAETLSSVTATNSACKYRVANW